MALVIDVQDFDRMSPEDAKAYAGHLAGRLAEFRSQTPPVPVTWIAMRRDAQVYEPEHYTGTGVPPVRDENSLTEMGFTGQSKEYRDFIRDHGPRVNETVVCKSVKSALLEPGDTDGKPDYRSEIEATELGGGTLAEYFGAGKTLAGHLREQGINKTFLMGAVSSHCVSETAVSAALKGFNPQILPDAVLSWHGDESTVNPGTSLLLWRGTGDAGAGKWDAFHQEKMKEKIEAITTDASRHLSPSDIAAIQKIDFLTRSTAAQPSAQHALHAQPAVNGAHT